MKRFYVQYVHRTEWPKREPPPQRARVLAFVTAELAQGRPWPSTLAISRHMGWKRHASALEALNGLMSDGRIRLRGHVDGRTRAWEIVE